MARKLSKKDNRYLARLVTVDRAPCAFCLREVDDEVTYGKLYAIGDIQCHYYCCLLSCCLIQKGQDDEGLFGFMYTDILAELERCKKHKCSYCGRSGANLGCSVSACRKQFHLPCGRERNAVSLYFGSYKSFCQRHAPKQKVPEHIMAKARLRVKERQRGNIHGALTNVPNSGTDLQEDTVCLICYEAVEASPTIHTFWPPCCGKDAWFHRACLQRMALSAGMHYLKCPLCNDKENFYEAVVNQGYYVPDRDAAWELEQNAFAEIYERPAACCADTCRCPRGRGHDADTGKWDIKLCLLCGSAGAHAHCIDQSEHPDQTSTNSDPDRLESTHEENSALCSESDLVQVSNTNITTNSVLSSESNIQCSQASESSMSPEKNVRFVCKSCKPAAPEDLSQLVSAIEDVIRREQAAARIASSGPVMPSRMSIGRTKGMRQRNRPSTSRPQPARGNTLDSSNTTSSRRELNLTTPRRRDSSCAREDSVEEDARREENNLLSPLKMLEQRFREKMSVSTVSEAALDALKQQVCRPRPLREKHRIVNAILQGVLADSKPRDPDECSPNKHNSIQQTAQPSETSTKRQEVFDKETIIGTNTPAKSPRNFKTESKYGVKDPDISCLYFGEGNNRDNVSENNDFAASNNGGILSEGVLNVSENKNCKNSKEILKLGENKLVCESVNVELGQEFVKKNVDLGKKLNDGVVLEICNQNDVDINILEKNIVGDKVKNDKNVSAIKQKVVNSNAISYNITADDKIINVNKSIEKGKKRNSKEFNRKTRSSKENDDKNRESDVTENTTKDSKQKLENSKRNPETIVSKTYEFNLIPQTTETIYNTEKQIKDSFKTSRDKLKKLSLKRKPANNTKLKSQGVVKKKAFNNIRKPDTNIKEVSILKRLLTEKELCAQFLLELTTGKDNNDKTNPKTEENQINNTSLDTSKSCYDIQNEKIIDQSLNNDLISTKSSTNNKSNSKIDSNNSNITPKRITKGRKCKTDSPKTKTKEKIKSLQNNNAKSMKSTKRRSNTNFSDIESIENSVKKCDNTKEVLNVLNNSKTLSSEKITDDSNTSLIDTPKSKIIEIQQDSSLEISENNQSVNIDVIKINDSPTTKESYKNLHTNLQEKEAPFKLHLVDEELFKNIDCLDLERFKKVYLSEVVKNDNPTVDKTVETNNLPNSDDTKNTTKKRKMSEGDLMLTFENNAAKKRKTSESGLEIDYRNKTNKDDICDENYKTEKSKSDKDKSRRCRMKEKRNKLKNKWRSGASKNIEVTIDSEKRRSKKRIKTKVAIRNQNIRVKIQWKKERLSLNIESKKQKKKPSKKEAKTKENYSPPKLKQYVLQFPEGSSKEVLVKPEKEVCPLKRKYVKQEKSPDKMKQMTIQSFFKIKSEK